MPGIVDIFTANRIAGSVADHCKVELYVGDCLVDTQESFPVKKGFRFRFHNPVGSVVGIETLKIRFQGELSAPEIDPKVTGYFPGKVDTVSVLRNYFEAVPEYPRVPPHLLDYIGSGDAGQKGFRNIGFTFFFTCLELLGLPSNSRVMDIGVGAGRIAFALAPYLSADGGAYTGFDTWNEGVEWAAANLTKVFPCLSFQSLPSPPQGHRKGYLADYSTAIPVPDDSFDLVLCSSLFTHLKRGAYVSYFKEIMRSLKPNALAMITAFLVNGKEFLWVKENLADDVDRYGAYVIDDTYADAYLIEPKFIQDIGAAGFILCRYIPGFWRESLSIPTRRYGDNYQDILILKKLT